MSTENAEGAEPPTPIEWRWRLVITVVFAVYLAFVPLAWWIALNAPCRSQYPFWAEFTLTHGVLLGMVPAVGLKFVLMSVREGGTTWRRLTPFYVGFVIWPVLLCAVMVVLKLTGVA